VLGQNASSPEESTRIAVATIIGEVIWPIFEVLFDTNYYHFFEVGSVARLQCSFAGDTCSAADNHT
jgi:hypothetical protein